MVAHPLGGVSCGGHEPGVAGGVGREPVGALEGAQKSPTATRNYSAPRIGPIPGKLSPAGEQRLARSVKHVSPVEPLAGVDADPQALSMTTSVLRSPLCPANAPPTAPYAANPRGSL
jgi:hypothetical protein